MLWPMLGSGTGTGLLILGWERTKEKHAALQDDQEKPEAVPTTRPVRAAR